MKYWVTQFGRLSRLLPDRMLLLGTDGTVLACNPGGARALGTTPEEALGMPIGDLLALDAEEVRDALRLWTTTSEPTFVSVRPARADAEHRSYRGEGSRVEGYDGRPATVLLRLVPTAEAVRHFVELNRKIEELHAEMDARVRAESEARAARDRLEAVVRLAPDPIVTTDADGRVTLLSRAGESAFGLSSTQARGRSLDEIAPVLDGPEWSEILYAAVGAADAVTHLRVATPRGARSVEASISAIDGASGGSRVLVIRDVTERERREHQQRQNQKLEVVGQLTGGIAHDFNNLLTVLIGSLEIFDLDLPADSPLRETLWDARLATERGARLTRQLLAYARKQPLEPTVVALDEVFEEFRALLEKAVPESIETHVYVGKGIRPCRIDVAQMQSTMLNLVLNARDAMPDGGTLWVVIRNHSDFDFGPGLPRGPAVILEVTDTGVGIPEENLEQVFEPFFTTKGQAEGTGLGLSMVYGFVRQSGGTVRIDSEPGRGTRVTVALRPVQMPQSDEADSVPWAG